MPHAVAAAHLAVAARLGVVSGGTSQLRREKVPTCGISDAGKAFCSSRAVNTLAVVRLAAAH